MTAAERGPSVAPADHTAFFAAHPPFDALEPDALAAVVASAELVYFPRGERVLTQGGEPARHTFLIRKGAVRLERDGQAVIVLEEGDLFGFPSLASGDPPAFDVATAEDTLAYRIPGGPESPLLRSPAWSGFLLHGFQDRLRRTAERDAPAGALAEPLDGLVRGEPVWLEGSASIRTAARVMRDQGISSVLVEGDPPGIVTDRDLRNRVLADGLGPETSLAEVATRPVRTLPAEAPIHEAVAFMLQHQVHHLPVTDRDGRITGVITNGDLLRHRSQSPLHLGRHLGKLDSPAAAEGYADEVAATVERLFDQGVEALRIGRVIAGLNDTLVQGALRLAEAELGPPPRPYEWIVFGSEGRYEQTLLTDQDNALVWADPPVGEAGSPGPEGTTDPADPAEPTEADVRRYFAELARHVVATLLRAGFPRCAGGYMATRWAMSRAEWEDRFWRWIRLEEPAALLDAANFFDFRGVRGELSLEPLGSALRSAGEDRIFLAHLAAAALRFRPPLGLFGRLKDHDGTVDIKRDGVMPVVGLARVYGLAAGSAARSTVDRLQAAADAGILSHQDAATLGETFSLLARLRLRAQLDDRRSGSAPTNRIALDDLSTLERRHLKEALLLLRDAQDALAQRFQAQRLG